MLQHCALISLLFAGFLVPPLAADWTALGPWGGEVRDLAIDPADGSRLLVGTGEAGAFLSRDSGESWRAARRRALERDVRSVAVCAGRAWAVSTLGDVSRLSGERWLRDETVLPFFADGLRCGPGDTVYAWADNSLWHRRSTGRWERILRLDFRSEWAYGVDPLDRRRVFVVTDVSVMRSDDAGVSWVRIADSPFRFPWPIRDLEVTAGGRVLYVASEAVWRSDDGGRSWARTALEVGANALAATVRNGRIVFAATPRGVFKSRDGGARWRRVFLGAEREAIDVEIDAAHPEAVYVATAGRSRTATILASRDGGATWEPSVEGMHAAVVDPLAVDPEDERLLYASLSGYGVQRRAADGSWAALAAPAADLPVELDPHDPRQLWGFSPSRAGVWRSADAGAHWSHLAASPFAGATWVVFDPVRAERLYLLSAGGVFRSLDGGVSWDQVLAAEELGFPVLDLVVSPVDPDIVYGIGRRTFGSPRDPRTEDRLLVSEDGGSTWRLHPTVFSRIYDVAPDARIARGVWFSAGDGLRRSEDAALTLTSIAVGVFDLAAPVASSDALWAITSVCSTECDTTVARSLDGGHTWTEAAGLPDNAEPRAVLVHPESGAVFVYGIGVFRWSPDSDR